MKKLIPLILILLAACGGAADAPSSTEPVTCNVLVQADQFTIIELPTGYPSPPDCSVIDHSGGDDFFCRRDWCAPASLDYVGDCQRCAQ